MNSTRYGAAKDALQEVQKRHDDIKKIERTIEVSYIFKTNFRLFFYLPN